MGDPHVGQLHRRSTVRAAAVIKAAERTEVRGRRLGWQGRWCSAGGGTGRRRDVDHQAGGVAQLQHPDALR